MDLHLTFLGNPNWAISSWALPQLLDFEILFLDLGLLVSLYAGWKVAQRYNNSKKGSFLIFTPWSVVYILFFLVAVWIIFQPMDMRGTMISQKEFRSYRSCGIENRRSLRAEFEEDSLTREGVVQNAKLHQLLNSFTPALRSLLNS